MLAPLPVRYASSADISIAYHIVGSGPPHIVLTPGFVSHIELGWELPAIRRFVERLASFSQVIHFDKRGTGMSDRVSDQALPTLEQRADDIRAVIDAVGLKRAVLLGVSDGGTMAAFFAASRPERVESLILYGTATHNEWKPSPAEFDHYIRLVRSEWGSASDAQRTLQRNAPSVADDPDWLAWATRFLRGGASPGAVVALTRMNLELDIRSVLRVIRVPTLVLHRTDDHNVPVEQGRLLARLIPGAQLVELPGNDHWIWAGDQDAVIDEVEDFLTGVRDAGERNRVLATVVFTDIVDSTATALELGDRRWRELLDRHNALVRRALHRFGGEELDTAGDGFLTSFSGPARAVRFASHVVGQAPHLGIEVRAGVHTGECERHEGKLAGVAIHVGARIAGLAGAGEVLVSSTVRDLVAGSGLAFEDRGEQRLRGLSEAHRVYALVS